MLNPTLLPVGRLQNSLGSSPLGQAQPLITGGCWHSCPLKPSFARQSKPMQMELQEEQGLTVVLSALLSQAAKPIPGAGYPDGGMVQLQAQGTP